MTLPTVFSFAKTASSVAYGPAATPAIKINGGANPADYFIATGEPFVLSPGDDFGLICDPTVQACTRYPPCIRVPPMPPAAQVAIRRTVSVNGDTLSFPSGDVRIITSPADVRTAIDAFDDGGELVYHVYRINSSELPALEDTLIAIPLEREPDGLHIPTGPLLDAPSVGGPRKPRKPTKPVKRSKARKAVKAVKAKPKAAKPRKKATRAKPRKAGRKRSK